MMDDGIVIMTVCGYLIEPNDDYGDHHITLNGQAYHLRNMKTIRPKNVP